MNGKELKIKRIQMDIKQKILAEYIHVSQAYLSMMENQKVRIPDNIYNEWIKHLIP